jgi:hypothetical protein
MNKTANSVAALAAAVALALAGCSTNSDAPTPGNNTGINQPAQPPVTSELSPRGAIPIQIGETVGVGTGQQPDWEFTVAGLTKYTPGECPSEFFESQFVDGLTPESFFLAMAITVHTNRFPPSIDIFNPYGGTWTVVGESGAVVNDAATYSAYRCTDGEYSVSSPLPNTTYNVLADVMANEPTGVIVIEVDDQRWELPYS